MSTQMLAKLFAAMPNNIRLIQILIILIVLLGTLAANNVALASFAGGGIGGGLTGVSSGG